MGALGQRNRNLGLIHAPIFAGTKRLWDHKDLLIKGEQVSPAFWFDGIGLDATAKTWTCRQTGTVLVLAGAGSDPSFVDPGPHLGETGSHQPINGKLWAAPDNSFGNVSTDDFLFELVSYQQNNSLPFGKLFGTGTQLLYTAGTWRFLVNVSGAVTWTIASTGGGFEIIHGWVNRDEASTNGSRAYANAVGGTGVDCSAQAGDSDCAAKMALGHNNGGQAGAYGAVAVIQVSQWHAADMIAAGATGKNEMDALVKDRASLWMGHTLLHNHGPTTPDTL